MLWFHTKACFFHFSCLFISSQHFNYFRVQLLNCLLTLTLTVCDVTMLFAQLNLKTYSYEHVILKYNCDLTCCLLKLFALRLGFVEVEQDFLQFILSVLEFCLKHRNL